MKVKSQMRQKGDGDANVVEIDLGEKVNAAIKSEAAKLAGKGGSSSKFSRYAGSYRPGMYGGYKPWYAQNRSGLSGGWKLGELLKMPEDVKKVGAGLLTGTLIGAAGNRIAVWGLAKLFSVQNNILAEAIGFGVGLLPLIGARNSTTVGIALPGLVQLVGALTEAGLEGLNIMNRPALSGAQGRRPQQMAGPEAAAAARKKLAEVQNRINVARTQAAQLPQRVLARPRAVGAA